MYFYLNCCHAPVDSSIYYVTDKKKRPISTRRTQSTWKSQCKGERQKIFPIAVLCGKHPRRQRWAIRHFTIRTETQLNATLLAYTICT